MDILQSVFMGILQGLTEFLPISSSGHLFAVPWLFGWKDFGLSFDVSLHIGTLVAVIAYFWHDWMDILRKWRQPLLWLLILGCFPAAVAGLLFEDKIETLFRDPLLVGIFMIFMGLLLWLAEAAGKKSRGLKDIGLKDSLVVGFSQVLALMPGVSRSGITMTAGLFSGMTRETAARFSFLLSTPIILGAGIYKLRHVFSGGVGENDMMIFLAGMMSSALVGFLAIKYLLKYLQSHTFYVFVWYRMFFGAIILAAVLFRR